MDRKLLLNIIIVAIVSFYLIFSIVYRGMIEQNEPDLTDGSVWEQPYLIPKGWTLQQIEFPNANLQLSENGWSGGDKVSAQAASLIANNWSALVMQDVTDYDENASGSTALVFVAEQTQPIVYRLIQEADQIRIYRLTDKRLFTLPSDLKPVIWID